MRKLISKILSMVLITLVFLSGEGMTIYYHICKLDNTADISLITEADFHDEAEHRQQRTHSHNTGSSDNESCCKISHTTSCCNISISKESRIDNDCCEKIVKNNILEPVNFNSKKSLKLAALIQPTIKYEQLNIKPLYQSLDNNKGIDISPHKIIHYSLISFIHHKSADKTDLPSLA